MRGRILVFHRHRPCPKMMRCRYRSSPTSALNHMTAEVAMAPQVYGMATMDPNGRQCFRADGHHTPACRMIVTHSWMMGHSLSSLHPWKHYRKILANRTLAGCSHRKCLAKRMRDTAALILGFLRRRTTAMLLSMEKRWMFSHRPRDPKVLIPLHHLSTKAIAARHPQ